MHGGFIDSHERKRLTTIGGLGKGQADKDAQLMERRMIWGKRDRRLKASEPGQLVGNNNGVSLLRQPSALNPPLRKTWQEMRDEKWYFLNAMILPPSRLAGSRTSPILAMPSPAIGEEVTTRGESWMDVAGLVWKKMAFSFAVTVTRESWEELVEGPPDSPSALE